MATASRYIFQKLGEYLGARPKSKAERYGFKGEPMVDDPAHEQASSEPSHPEDEQLFGAGSREPLPTRGRADDLGRVPIIPPEVLKSGRLDDVVTPLEFLPGLYELKVLVQRLVSLTEGEEDVIAYANHLQTDCLSMLDLMKGFNSTSPPLEKAVTRMREELMKTLVHLECQAKKRHRIRILLQRESIFERLLRCDEARKRIMQEYQILQGNEILHTIRAQNPHADALKERIQAAEEEVQHLLRRETGKNIPREMILQERIKYRQSPAVCVSQRFSVYKGELVSGEAIAIKFSEVKSSLDNDEGRNFGRRILRHASTWASFDSKYILPFLGMGVQIVEQSEEGKRDYYKVYFVSPWMPCGNAVNYIQESHKQRLHVDVTKLVRDIALGLQYLHQQDEPCIHGSVRGENVLIKLERGIEQACLNGFALTKRQVQTEAAPEMTGEDKIHRWKAPEIINATSRNPLMEPPSDIWSWAMTALELYSGKEPYHYHVKDRGVMADITIGKAPIRGEYPTFETYASHPDAIWALFEKCWKMEPKERPTIQEVIRELDTITAMPRASR